MGRVKCPWPSGDRIYLTLADNSTLTYDLYQPLNEPKGILNKHLAHTAKKINQKQNSVEKMYSIEINKNLHYDSFDVCLLLQ